MSTSLLRARGPHEGVRNRINFAKRSECLAFARNDSTGPLFIKHPLHTGKLQMSNSNSTITAPSIRFLTISCATVFAICAGGCGGASDSEEKDENSENQSAALSSEPVESYLYADEKITSITCEATEPATTLCLKITGIGTGTGILEKFGTLTTERYVKLIDYGKKDDAYTAVAQTSGTIRVDSGSAVSFSASGQYYKKDKLESEGWSGFYTIKAGSALYKPIALDLQTATGNLAQLKTLQVYNSPLQGTYVSSLSVTEPEGASFENGVLRASAKSTLRVFTTAR